MYKTTTKYFCEVIELLGKDGTRLDFSHIFIILLLYFALLISSEVCPEHLTKSFMVLIFIFLHVLGADGW